MTPLRWPTLTQITHGYCCREFRESCFGAFEDPMMVWSEDRMMNVSEWLTVPLRYDAVDVEITLCDVCERTISIPFHILLPVSCRVVRCFIIDSILHWIQKIVQRGNLFFIRVNFLGQILSGFYPVLELLRVRESTRVTVSADKDVLVDSYSSLLLSFGGNLSFWSVFLSTVALILLLMRFFQVIVYITLLNSKTNFLSLYLLNLILIRTAFFGSFLMFVVPFIGHI